MKKLINANLDNHNKAMRRITNIRLYNNQPVRMFNPDTIHNRLVARLKGIETHQLQLEAQLNNVVR